MGLKEVVFAHKIKTVNTGDLSICPYDAFSDVFERCVVKRCDLDDVGYFSFKSAIFILGGGGLLNHVDAWNKAINKLLSLNKIVIGWGIGFNNHIAGAKNSHRISEYIDFNKFSLLGVRDILPGYSFVPCVSAIGIARFPSINVVRKIGAVFHYEFPVTSFNFEFVYNNQDLFEIWEFISRSEYILTNTYHGMYWATLLGKKVILLSSFSEKFKYFKWRPYEYNGSIDDALLNAVNYPDALSEAVRINKDFLGDVMELCDL